jgi:hypothetical protein
LLNDDDARWFAKVQAIYHELQKQNTTVSFGEIPGTGKPYGFYATTPNGAVCTIVNPSQQMEAPGFSFNSQKPSRILYADGGFRPKIHGEYISLGPEQLAVIGYGEYAQEKYDLGTDDTIKIPDAIDKIAAAFVVKEKNNIKGEIHPPKGKDLRIILQQFDAKGLPFRSWPGSPPDGKKVSEVIKIEVTQDGKKIPLHVEYDKVIWSGLSWATAEVKQGSFDLGKPLTIKCSSDDKNELRLNADVYAVSYTV